MATIIVVLGIIVYVLIIGSAIEFKLLDALLHTR